MGCQQSVPAATLSGAPPAAAGRTLTEQAIAAAAALSDPAAVARSREIEALALADAEAAFAANAGKSVRDAYVRMTLSSYGANCKVFSAARRGTGEAVAVKSIRKESPANAAAAAAQRARVMREVGVTRLLQGHPHAVQLYGAFEDAKSYHVVTEWLGGGELFDHIAAAGALTEAAAADVCRALCLFLAHAHAAGVAHMDVKPENVMFDAEGSAGVLKVIDLGSAEFLQPNQAAARAFGTVRYCSPEMAKDVCGQRSDVWSAGVVMYQMLAGRVPFLKDSDEATLALLQKGPAVKFAGARWRGISDAAKDCIRAMLTPDPAQRPTAADVLRHPWLAAAAPATPIGADTLASLRMFASLGRARRLMLGVAARALSGAEASRLLRSFLAVDKDFNGTLDLRELTEAAREVAPEAPEHELAALFAALDVDGTGTVDAHEFFAAALAGGLGGGELGGGSGGPADLVVERSFRMLDRGSNGYFTRADLRSAVSASRPSAFAVRSPAGGSPAAGGGGAFGSPGGVGGAAGSPGGGGAAIGGGGVETSATLEGELDREFQLMDANGDGVVTLDEFKTALRAMSLDARSSASFGSAADLAAAAAGAGAGAAGAGGGSFTGGVDSPAAGGGAGGGVDSPAKGGGG